MSGDYENTGAWSLMFPEGRHIFYEGDDPEGFRAEIQEKFGFDPANSSSWGVLISDGPDDEDAFTSYGFDCPAEHLDAIDSDQYPIGT
jgi:hypothetical protein